MQHQLFDPPMEPLLQSNAQACLQPLQHTMPWCVVIRNFLTLSDCTEFIAHSERRGYRAADADYPPSYRDNARQVLDCVPLAERMFVRLRKHAALQIVAPSTPACRKPNFV